MSGARNVRYMKTHLTVAVRSCGDRGSSGERGGDRVLEESVVLVETDEWIHDLNCIILCL